LADSLIYATARRCGATRSTQDQHFKELPGLEEWAKKAATR
jgi:predicted nucleic acid-binding protein